MTALPMAFVFHANQFVITDGYPDRDGISRAAVGFDAVLSLHVEMGIPASLHISGPLLESLAWHRPAALRRLRSHLDSGLITLIGGTYGENIMPLSSPQMNVRQLRAYHDQVENLLGVPRSSLKTAWVPERVWDTESCAPPLLDASATGVRYRRVLLDDRLRMPLADGDYPGSARAEFDASGPYNWHSEGFPTDAEGLLYPEALLPYRIAGADGLTAVPLASHLRYLIPPHDPSHLNLLGNLIRRGAQPPIAEGSALVFADDLERVAGVGGWEKGLERHAQFLEWLVSDRLFNVVALDDWYDRVDPETEVEVDPGCYFELAHTFGAGEDYRRWGDDPRWQPYTRLLNTVEQELEDTESSDADPGLCWLAERVLMLGHHETAWQDHDPAHPGTRAPAPWARATAAHAADAPPLLVAARWVRRLSPRGPRVLLSDIDRDGADELVLSNDRLFAVLSPRHGGRLTLLVNRQISENEQPRGIVLLGNPADHWNFQEELHQHMQIPPNHPGALGICGTETHNHEVTEMEIVDGSILVELKNTEPGPDLGLTKRLVLDAHTGAIVVCAYRPGLPGELRTTVALSPDYPELLRTGRQRMHVEQGSQWWGVKTAGASAWVAHYPYENTELFTGSSPNTGHGFVGGVEGCGRHIHLVLGAGAIADVDLAALMRNADDLLHAPSHRLRRLVPAL